MSRKILEGSYEIVLYQSRVSFHWRETHHAHPRVWNVLRNQTFHGNNSSREKAWLREAHGVSTTEASKF